MSGGEFEDNRVELDLPEQRSWVEICGLAKRIHWYPSLFSPEGSQGMEAFSLDQELKTAFLAAPEERIFRVLDLGGGQNGIALDEVVEELENLSGGRRQVEGRGMKINDLYRLATSAREGSSGSLAIPLPDETIDFGYSSLALQYVGDALRALEEGYRVLREGGTMYWILGSMDDVSSLPNFETILDNTPGANDIFRWLIDHNEDRISVIQCKKDSSKGFRGFPYDYLFSHPKIMRLSLPQPDASHLRYGVYAHREGTFRRVINAMRGLLPPRK